MDPPERPKLMGWDPILDFTGRVNGEHAEGLNYRIHVTSHAPTVILIRNLSMEMENV